jgi:hypothetical protein
VKANQDGMKILFYDQEGNVLYSTQSVPPRQKVAKK